jgi:hypothetical protein
VGVVWAEAAVVAHTAAASKNWVNFMGKGKRGAGIVYPENHRKVVQKADRWLAAQAAVTWPRRSGWLGGWPTQNPSPRQPFPLRPHFPLCP